MPIRRSCAKAYLWLRDDLEPLHLARFGTPSQREEVPLGRVRHVEAMGKKNNGLFGLIIIFYVNIFWVYITPIFRDMVVFFNVGLWFTKTWIVQTTWRWLHVFPTKVRSTNELIMVDPRTYGSYVMLYPPALTLIWMWPPQVSLFITFYNPINNYRYHLYPP